MKHKGKPSLDLQSNLNAGKLDVVVKSRTNTIMSKKRKATLRSDGRWQVYVNVNGKRKACYGRTEYKANCQADILEADDETRILLMDVNHRCIFANSFILWRNYLLYYTNLTGGTIDRYESTYDKYFKGSLLDQKDVRYLNNKDIYNFLIKVLNDYGSITHKEYQRIRHIIKAIINFVYDEELDDWDSESEVDFDKIKRRLPQGKIYNRVKKQYAVSETDKSILKSKVLDEDVYSERFAHVVMILINFSLGLRIGELAVLTVDDVDMRNRIVRVNNSIKRSYIRDEYGNKTHECQYTVGTTKTPKGVREIPISNSAYALFDILFEYRKTMGYSSKFLAYDGNDDVKCRAESLAGTLETLCGRVGVDKINSHLIRKSFASALSKCPDIDIATISEYMGHAQVSTTLNTYIIPANETIDAKIKQMSDYV